MELAPRYTLLTLFILFKLLCHMTNLKFGGPLAINWNLVIYENGPWTLDVTGWWWWFSMLGQCWSKICSINFKCLKYFHFFKRTKWFWPNFFFLRQKFYHDIWIMRCGGQGFGTAWGGMDPTDFNVNWTHPTKIPPITIYGAIVQTLPKAQRTRGLCSSCQSNFLRSHHKFKNKSWSHFIFRMTTIKHRLKISTKHQHLH